MLYNEEIVIDYHLPLQFPRILLMRSFRIDRLAGRAAMSI